MRQAMWRIALEPQVILPTSAYSIQHATDGSVSIMGNASISQFVSLYSAGSLSFSKTAKWYCTNRKGERHGWRLRNVGMAAIA